MNLMTMRQVSTEILLVLDLTLAAFMFLYLVRKWRLFGWAARYRDEVQAATAFLTLMIGHSILRAWGTVLLHAQDRGVPLLTLEEQMPIGLAGLMVSVAGMLCAIRVFSRADWGHWAWLTAGAAALSFAALMRAF